MAEKWLGLVSKFSLLLAVIFTTAGIITWIAAKAAVVLVAQILIWTFGVLAILAGLVGVISFGAWRIGWLSLRLVELSRDKTLASNEAHQADIETARSQMHLMAEGRLMAAAVRQVENGLIHPAQLGEGTKFSSFPASVIKQVENEVPLLEAPRQELLPAIRGMQNILIIGGTRTGKTTLMQWLETERATDGQTIALDSHAVPGQWAGQSIGAGREYGMIKNAMIALVNKMDSRHKERTAGKSQFELIHQFIDEFTLLPGYLKKAGYDVQDYSFPLLTEGRKVGMNCLWGTHSKRAKQLGLEGATDLQECFDVVVYLKKVKGEYYAICDFGEGDEDQKYTLPGPFHQTQSLPAPAIAHQPKEIEAPPVAPADMAFVVKDPEPNRSTDEEMKAIESFVSARDSGDTFYWKDATQLAFGVGKFGKNYTLKLKRILDKFAIDYSRQEVK